MFGEYKIDYGKDILFSRLFPAWMQFAVLLHAWEVVEDVEKEYLPAWDRYIRAGEQATEPEAPFPPQLKRALSKEVGHFALVRHLKPFFLWGLQQHFKITKGVKVLDPDIRKSLHKQPVFVEVMDELFVFLTAKRVTGYRAARLIHALFTRHGIMNPQHCKAKSLQRQLLRRKQKLL
jgi:hypothetical protein